MKITLEISKEEFVEFIKDLKTETKEEIRKPITSIYAKWFDESNPKWCKNPESNLMFLRNQEALANSRLKGKGYLLLNDVYEMLDIPKTNIGDMVGWVYNEKNPIGDNFIDFGIYERQCNIDFVNGKMNNVLLDFNVDGVITSYIK